MSANVTVDIVVQLRSLPERMRRTPIRLGDHVRVLQEAADEIERLTRERVIEDAHAATWRAALERYGRHAAISVLGTNCQSGPKLTLAPADSTPRFPVGIPLPSQA